jgi:hypothetical protein
MKARKILPWVAAAVLVLVCTGVALALDLGNVDGVWSTIDSGGGATCDGWATSNPFAGSDTSTAIQTPPNTDENQVRYGNPAVSGVGCPDNDNSDGYTWTQEFNLQSGFGFDGVQDVSGPLVKDQPFLLGRFTHYNRPISAPDNAFGYVDLNVTVSNVQCTGGGAPSEGSSMAFNYRFQLDETSNTVGTCAYSPIIPADNYCPDKVTVSGAPPAQQFTCVGEGNYTVTILGFIPIDLGVDCADQQYNSGAVTGNFITQENAENDACLWAQITDYVPTAVELRSFTGTGAEKSVKLSWETASELDNLGFNLYRAERPNGLKTKINEALIPANVPPGSPAGAVYDYVDLDLAPRHGYWYWLEDVDINGRTMLHGPVVVKVR